MVKIKAVELRKQDKESLLKKLSEQRAELSKLRATKASANSQQKTGSIGIVRKNIARILTVLSQAQREATRQFYLKKKYIPTDLRVKKTRAIRRALKPSESRLVTVREQKKRTHFPLRKYAVKA